MDKVKMITEISLSKNRRLKFGVPMVMGVLNITPDSFSDGGRHIHPDKAVARAKEMIAEGAAIIDIGGESSRPGADPVTPDEELRRVIPIIKQIRDFSTIPMSIDTIKAEVAQQAMEAGADIINDISGLRYDRRMPDVAAEFKAPIILMHMKGDPKTMQVDPSYHDCIREIHDFFEFRINFLDSCGVKLEKIIIDPGIGFGKRLKDNLAIIKHFDVFKSIGHPLMVGVSRKSFIGHIAGEDIDPTQRLGGSLAAALLCACHGADIIRAHDVKQTVQAIQVWRAVEEAE